MTWADDFAGRLSRSRLSLGEVARLAGLDQRHVTRLANGQRQPRRATRKRLDQVFKDEFYRLKNHVFVKGDLNRLAMANVKGDAERLDMIRGLYKSAAGLLCDRAGLDVERLLNSNLHNLSNEYAVLKARREAIYLVSVGNNISAAEIGRALGLSRAAVSRMIAQVEDSRREGSLDDSRLTWFETLVGGVQF